VYVPLWKCYSATTSGKPRDSHLRSATNGLQKCYRVLRRGLFSEVQIKKRGAAYRLATEKTMVTFADKRFDDRGWRSREQRPRLGAGYAQGYI
jgi:hypothetical protein